MKQQRMHRTGCSMLAAALIGLLPIAVAYADDVNPALGQQSDQSFGQQSDQSTGAQGPARDDTSIGAQGPVRDDASPTFDSNNSNMEQGPISNENLDATPNDRGTQGPMREDSTTLPSQDRYYGNSGAQGPMREDTTTMPPQDQYYGNTGPQGPIRQDMDTNRMRNNMDQSYPYPPNVSDPRKDFDTWFHAYHGESNPLIDRGGGRDPNRLGE